MLLVGATGNNLVNRGRPTEKGISLSESIFVIDHSNRLVSVIDCRSNENN